MEKKKRKYIFVHGLSGWGSYEKAYKRMPYWGMRNGDLIVQLRKEGYDAYCASVSPQGSAYDRSCELYAQLAGTKTDYGVRHAQRYSHERYGPDFTGKPLIEDLEGSELVLLGHSFGGATIRRFAHIMEHGIEEEGGSDFFKGGKKENIFALVCLAAPHNGTTAYDMYQDEDFDPYAIKGDLRERIGSSLMSRSNKTKSILPEDDCAAYDMHIDNALAMNVTMPISKDIWYFSQPCCMTMEDDKGDQIPVKDRVEAIYSRTSRRMGAYMGKTKGGLVIDESWKANDGLVNTVSSMYPMSDPHRAFDQEKIEKGVWNVFDVYKGDHMSLQGGLMIKNDVSDYYRRLLALIDSLN